MSGKNKNESSERKNQPTKRTTSRTANRTRNRTAVAVALFAIGLVVLYLLFNQYLQRPEPVASGQPGASAGQAAVSAGDEAPEIGKRAPNFTVQDINGKTVSLSSLRGKVVMLNFWATWCPPCQAELPEIQRAYNLYRKRSDDVAMVLVDVGESENKVRSFLTQKRYDLPVAFDFSGEVANLYLVRGIPTTFFIDRNGVVQDIFVGATHEAEIKERINALMR